MTAPVVLPIVAPVSCRWLDALDAPHADLRRALVRRAHADIGIEESTAANRSPYIDEVMEEAGSPKGLPWCGGLARRWCKDVGAAYPERDAGAVRNWVTWAKARGTWYPRGSDYTALPGDLVVYDFHPDGIGDHIDVLARAHVRGPRTIGGNTSYGGQSRDGIACAFKPGATGALVLGYIELTPAAS